jgi:hypothetical protein
MHGTRKDWNRDGTSRRRRVKKEKDGEEKEREEIESVEETEGERRKRRRVDKGKGKAKAETDGSDEAEWRKALTEVVLGIEEQIEEGFDELWRRVSMKIDEGVERVMRRVQRLEDNMITESDLEEGPSRRTGGLKRKAEENDSEVEVVAERFGESGWLDLEAEETDREGSSEEGDEDGEKEEVENDDDMDIY